MCADGNDPVADDELVMRRVSTASMWYDPQASPPLNWLAFKPNQNDTNGVSVWRGKYLTPDDVAKMNARPNRRYYVVAIQVAALRGSGIEVIASPQEGGAGHASLANLNSSAYDQDPDLVREMAIRASELNAEIYGPFGPF